MNTARLVRIVSPLALILLASASIAGPLTPAVGPVGSTMKTMVEVEPRMAINSVNTPGDADATPSTFKITQPGSYYLTGNIVGEEGKHGIEVRAAGVTIDLNGFAVTGVARSLSGILLATGGTEVRNGTVRLWGSDGISGNNTSSNRVIGVRAIANGGIGIDTGNYSEARDCVSESNGFHGIAVYAFGRVDACNAKSNAGDGIYAGNSNNIIVNCTSNANGGNGFKASNSNTLIGCTAASNTLSGFDAISSVVRNCSSEFNTQYGFFTSNASVVSGSSARFNSGGGFSIGPSSTIENNTATSNGNSVAGRSGFTISSGSRASGNHAVGNPIGFEVFGNSVLKDNTSINSTTGFFTQTNANAVLMSNIAVGNTTNYTINAGNDSGAVITNPGVGFTTTNPAANVAN